MKLIIEQQIDTILLDMASGKQPSEKHGKVGDFRVSSMPFCPLRELLFTDKNASYGMDFFTSMGTAVHETAQKWLARGNYVNKIFACWKCPRCKTVHGPSFRPDSCGCGANEPLEYEEITISYRGLSGHVDLVIEVLPGKFVVVDFKTTNLGLKKVKYKDWLKFYPASRSSIMQISTYSTLLRETLGLNIVGWCLVYVDRGDKITSDTSYHKYTRPWGQAKHDSFLKHINHACKSNKLLRRLDHLLQTESEFSPTADSLLRALVKRRPCVDEDSYDAWMCYKFYQGFTKVPDQGTKNGQCILKKACCTGHRAAYEAVQKLL